MLVTQRLKKDIESFRQRMHLERLPNAARLEQRIGEIKARVKRLQELVEQQKESNG